MTCLGRSTEITISVKDETSISVKGPNGNAVIIASSSSEGFTLVIPPLATPANPPQLLNLAVTSVLFYLGYGGIYQCWLYLGRHREFTFSSYQKPHDSLLLPN